MGKARKKRRRAQVGPPPTAGELRREYASALVTRTRLFQSLADLTAEATSGSVFWLQTAGIGLMCWLVATVLGLLTLPIVGVFAGVLPAAFWLCIRNACAKYARRADRALSIWAAVGFVVAAFAGGLTVPWIYLAHYGTPGVATFSENIGPSTRVHAERGDRCVVRMPDQSRAIFTCRPGNDYPVYYDTHLGVQPEVGTKADLHAGVSEGVVGGALAFAMAMTVVGLGRTRPGVLREAENGEPARIADL